MKFSPGNDTKLILCVLGMTLNSSVVVQGGHACAFGHMNEAVSGGKPPCRKGCGWYVKLTWLALLSLYYIL